MTCSRSWPRDSVLHIFDSPPRLKTRRIWPRQHCVRVAIGLLGAMAIFFCLASCDELGKAPSQPVRRTSSNKVPAAHQPQSGGAQQPNVPVSTKQNPTSAGATTRPDALRGDLQKMFAFIKARRTGPARVQLLKHLKMHPDDGQATFLFGLSYHREQKYGKAIPYYEKALGL